MSSQPTRIFVEIRRDDFDLSQEHAALVDGDRGIGAVAAFVGMVHDRTRPINLIRIARRTRGRRIVMVHTYIYIEYPI